VASYGYGSKRYWLDRNVCRIRQELKPMTDGKPSVVASAVPSGFFLVSARKHNALGTAHTTAKRAAGFTLAEVLISVAVLVLLVLLFTQLFNSAATVTILGHKQMDADSQARELLDRMALDVMQMVKRSDVYYHLKASTSATDCPATEPDGSPGCWTQTGNDEIAFYSNVPGYFPSTVPNSNQRSSVSIVGYRMHVSTDTLANRLERLGSGLVWTGATSDTPLVFWTPLNPWAFVTIPPNNTDIMGPHVFRFEYYYLLKNGTLSATPWYTASSVRGMQDVAAIVADIAVIDPRSRAPLTDAQLTTLTTPGNANFLTDYTSGMTPGQLRTQWQTKVNAITTLPRVALSNIRFYERHLYLSPPALITP